MYPMKSRTGIHGWAAVAIVMFSAIRTAANPTEHARAMEAGQREISRRSASGHARDFFNFSAAHAYFRIALERAETDRETIAAHLALADSRLNDVQVTQYVAIRDEYVRVLEVESASPQERAHATLGIGETLLREGNAERAREAFNRAAALWDQGDWPARVRLAVARSYLSEHRCGDALQELKAIPEMPGVSPARGVGWEANALAQAVALQGKIHAGRPRLFLNDTIWPAAKERALTTENALFTQMQTRVNQTALQDITPGDWGLRAMEAAWVYRVTGDFEILEIVQHMLRSSVTHYRERTEDRTNSPSRIGWLAAFDWVYQDLDPRERRALSADMLNYLHSMYIEDQVQGNVHRVPHYYKREVYWYGGLGLLDPTQTGYDRVRILELLATGYGHNRDAILDRLATGREDGAWQVNLGYSLALLPASHTWNFMYSWESALGDPIPRDWVNIGVPPDYALRQIVNMGPAPHPVTWQDNRIHHFGYSRTQSMIRADLLYDHLSHFKHFFGDSHPDHAAIAHHLLRRVESETGVTDHGPYPVFRFLMTRREKAPAPALPSGLPTARHFAGVGQVLMSSGFGPTDTHALFIIGGGRNSPLYTTTSNHFDATHFTIYKQGYLALDSGIQNAGTHSANYYYQTVAHNAVLIRMPGETIPGVTANSGGQRRLHHHAQALAFETNPLFAYSATDATDTYHEDKCAQMVRQFLYLPPDHFVVFDRVTATRPDYPKTWLFHTANEPVVTGREFYADQGRGRIFFRTLYPEDSVLETIGGPGREFWADGRNWPIPDTFVYWNYVGMEPGGEIPEHLGRWRVEVKPGAARAEDYFLHLIQTSDQRVERMVSSRVRPLEDQIELSFSAGTRAYVVRFNTAGPVGGRLRISENGRVLADAPFTDALMPQSGLARKNPAE